MKKVELLSPVGDIEAMYQAVHNGCDAVYLGGTFYGARKFADNFSNEKLVYVIKYCHLYGVRVYVTVNTLIYERELEDCLKYIEFLYVNGCDAIIVQDIGLISLVRKRYPDMEVHASTQVHNYNEDGIKFLKELGVSRVVMARELSLKEINEIEVDIEKEVFVHGALCVSYSGCCLFSSLNGGRSGNRGECVGSCRLAYKLIRNEEEVKLKERYLLSTKELNTTCYLDKLIESGVDSLKIEGRMKSAYYVGYVTRLYRMLIDGYYNGEWRELDEEEVTNLKKLYNRGFTCGYLFGDKSIMNRLTPNHQGVEIGKVIGVDKKYIKIRLDDYLVQNDGIRFKGANVGMVVNRLYDSNKLLKNKIEKDSVCYLDKRFDVEVGDVLIKTVDSLLVKELENYRKKRIEINIRVECLINKRIVITIDDGSNKVRVCGDIVEEALKREVSREDIVKCVSKLGNTPFEVKDILIIKDDNIFIGLSNLNEIRRKAVSQLIFLRENKRGDIVIKEEEDSLGKKKDDLGIFINVLIRNEEQLKCCLDNGVNNIYVTEYDLYEKYKYLDNVYYKVDRLDNKRVFDGERLLVSEIGNIYKYGKNNELVGDYYLNVTNSESMVVFRDWGVRRVTLSVELDDSMISDIGNKCYNSEVIVYGRLELMLMKYCLLRECLNYCSNCKESRDKFYLESSDKKRYPLIRNNCVSRIMHFSNIDKIDKIGDYREMGINNFRLELFEEGYKELELLIRRIKEFTM